MKCAQALKVKGQGAFAFLSILCHTPNLWFGQNWRASSYLARRSSEGCNDTTLVPQRGQCSPFLFLYKALCKKGVWPCVLADGHLLQKLGAEWEKVFGHWGQ